MLNTSNIKASGAFNKVVDVKPVSPGGYGVDLYRVQTGWQRNHSGFCICSVAKAKVQVVGHSRAIRSLEESVTEKTLLFCQGEID
jgi:hypothetical protein